MRRRDRLEPSILPQLSPSSTPLIAASRSVGRRGLTVIVPVYRDKQATLRCLRSLDAARKEIERCQVVIVDDASPEFRAQDLLDAFSDLAHVRAVAHERNLGFAASINTGLALAGADDVLLLNSDVALPAGALIGLQSHLDRDASIGTIAPLSNNGELTSCPRPFASGPLPDADAIEAANRALARFAPRQAVDIPSGVGFCLYVARACLDHVGGLARHYGRGYGEDIDFTLRAQEAGFRNICALDIYVGHEGTRSFGPDKQALVKHNLLKIDARWPGYRAQCALFMAADPLRSVRPVVADALGHSQRRILFVSASGSSEAIAQERSRTARERGEASAVLAFWGEARQAASLSLGDDLSVQAMRHDLADGADRDALRRRLLGLPLDAVEVIGSQAAAAWRDSGLRAAVSAPTRFGWIDADPGAAAAAADACASIIAYDAEAAAAATAHVNGRHGGVERAPWPAMDAAGPQEEPNEREGAVAVAPWSGRWPSPRLLRAVALALHRVRKGRPIIVFGEDAGHQGVRRLPGLAFTGGYRLEDVAALAQRHRVSEVIIVGGERCLGHPLSQAFRSAGVAIKAIDFRQSAVALAP